MVEPQKYEMHVNDSKTDGNVVSEDVVEVEANLTCISEIVVALFFDYQYIKDIRRADDLDTL